MIADGGNGLEVDCVLEVLSPEAHVNRVFVFKKRWFRKPKFLRVVEWI